MLAWKTRIYMHIILLKNTLTYESSNCDWRSVYLYGTPGLKSNLWFTFNSYYTVLFACRPFVEEPFPCHEWLECIWPSLQFLPSLNWVPGKDPVKALGTPIPPNPLEIIPLGVASYYTRCKELKVDVVVKAATRVVTREVCRPPVKSQSSPLIMNPFSLPLKYINCIQFMYKKGRSYKRNTEFNFYKREQDIGHLYCWWERKVSPE